MVGLLERLAGGAVLVSDGAMGTQLFSRGLKGGESPETLNLSHPEYLQEIAREYREAGADIVHTNTFGGSPVSLAGFGLDDRTEEINRRAVEAARRGVAGQALVAGSCGPSGTILQPFGEADPDEVYAGFKRQLQALIAAGVDAVTVETMTDLNEAVLAIKAAREVSPTIPIIATMTFDDTPRGFYTIMGVDIPTGMAGLATAGADVIGSNCGDGLEKMIRIAPLLKAAGSLPVIIQSNAGQPEMTADGPLWPESPQFFADRIGELVTAGVSIIGGCCGTGPEHIRAIRQVLDRAKELG